MHFFPVNNDDAFDYICLKLYNEYKDICRSFMQKTEYPAGDEAENEQ